MPSRLQASRFFSLNVCFLGRPWTNVIRRRVALSYGGQVSVFVEYMWHVRRQRRLCYFFVTLQLFVHAFNREYCVLFLMLCSHGMVCSFFFLPFFFALGIGPCHRAAN